MFPYLKKHDKGMGFFWEVRLSKTLYALIPAPRATASIEPKPGFETIIITSGNYCET